MLPPDDVLPQDGLVADYPGRLVVEPESHLPRYLPTS